MLRCDNGVGQSQSHQQEQQEETEHQGDRLVGLSSKPGDVVLNECGAITGEKGNMNKDCYRVAGSLTIRKSRRVNEDIASREQESQGTLSCAVIEVLQNLMARKIPPSLIDGLKDIRFDYTRLDCSNDENRRGIPSTTKRRKMVLGILAVSIVLLLTLVCILFKKTSSLTGTYADQSSIWNCPVAQM